ncbi:MAG: CoA-binding protein [Chloroflexi bacterium]|nr:CoA-binding protein [Chloroflexota bacterium]
MPESIVEQLDHIFKPKSVAFIGASNDQRKWGYRQILSAQRNGFPGPIYPVNRHEEQVIGIPAYRSLLDIPGEVDMALITVPAPQVPQVLNECGDKGIRGAVIISSGFSEIGTEEGRRLQVEIVRVARQRGIRFVGPNCMGISSPAGRFSTAGGLDMRETGGIAFISQSGTMGNYLAAKARDRGFGLGLFVSSGNQADLGFADYLEYLAEDDSTKAIVLYMEGMSEGRRFFEVARQVLRHKPIAIYKAGRTAEGRKAVSSHTASLSGPDEVFDAICKQIGILRGHEVLHPFEMTQALATQPLPQGNRIGVLMTGGGQCVTVADACGQLGLILPELDAETQATLKQQFAPHVPPPRNPIDLAGSPPGLDIRILQTLASLDYIDGIILSAPSSIGMARGNVVEAARSSINWAEAVIDVSRKQDKPVIFFAMPPFANAGVGIELLRAAQVPIYETPEECARAMSALVRYAETRRRLNA